MTTTTQNAKATKQAEKQANKPAVVAVAPQGFGHEVSDDVVGFFDPETSPTGITGIPRGAKMSDSKLEPMKPSTFVIIELLAPCQVSNKEEVFTANAGDRVGLWFKPGMKALRNLCGVPMWLGYTGERDIGKPSPMKTYAIKTRNLDEVSKGTRIPILEDNRDKSKSVPTFLDQRGDGADDDNLPF